MSQKTFCFLSNHLTHHQLPFCLEMMKLTGGSFRFIETEQLPEERSSLGYEKLGDKYDFVVSGRNSFEGYCPRSFVL